MDVSKVTDKDGHAAARLAQLVAVAVRLIDALKLAGMPISGPGIDDREMAARWLGELTGQMAKDLQASRAVSAIAPVPKKKAVRRGKTSG